MRWPAAAAIGAVAALVGLLRSPWSAVARPGARSALTADSSPPRCAASFDGPVNDQGSAVASAGVISLQAGDSYFQPTCVGAVRAGEVTVRLVNAGRVLHNLSIASQGIDQDVAPRETVTVKVRMDGRPLQLSCKYHAGAGMVAALLPP